MTPDRHAPLPDDLADLGRRIRLWRLQRPKLSPMPDLLWQEALSLARKYSVFTVAKGLPVDYGSLKHRLSRASVTGPDGQDCSFAFVELSPEHLRSATELPVLVELSHPDGTRMTLRLHDSSGIDLAALARDFWRRGP